MRLLFLSSMLLMIFGANIFSQSVENNSTEKKLNFHLKVNHTTNSLFLGRSDSIETPYYGAEFGIAHKSGLYINAGLQYYPGRVDNKIDEYALTAGYNFAIIKDKLTSGLSYARTFYNDYSTQVTSEIQGVATWDISLDLSVFRAGLSTTANFGQSTDVLVSPSIGRDFSFEKVLGGSVTVGPTVTVSSGSQKLYALYKVKRTAKLRKQKVKGTPKTESSYDLFKVQDVSLSVPASFTYKKIVFTITPTYDMPQNTTAGDFTSFPFSVDFALQFNF